jgi:hypothetical protein
MLTISKTLDELSRKLAIVANAKSENGRSAIPQSTMTCSHGRR